jgi:hypothetical protein
MKSPPIALQSRHFAQLPFERFDRAEHPARAYLPQRAGMCELVHTQARNMVRLCVTRANFTPANTRSAAAQCQKPNWRIRGRGGLGLSRQARQALSLSPFFIVATQGESGLASCPTSGSIMTPKLGVRETGCRPSCIAPKRSYDQHFGMKPDLDRLRRANPTLFAHWRLCHGNGRTSGAV